MPLCSLAVGLSRARGQVRSPLDGADPEVEGVEDRHRLLLARGAGVASDLVSAAGDAQGGVRAAFGLLLGEPPGPAAIPLAVRPHVEAPVPDQAVLLVGAAHYPQAVDPRRRPPRSTCGSNDLSRQPQRSLHQLLPVDAYQLRSL